MSANKLILLLVLLAASAQAQIQNFSNDFIVSTTSSGGGGTSGTINSSSANRMAYYSAATTISGATGLTTDGAGTVSGTNLYMSTNLLVGGSSISTSMPLLNKQTGTTSSFSIATEAPNGTQGRFFCDSTNCNVNRGGATATQISIGSTGVGIGVAANVANASLTVAGPVSVTVLRTLGTISGGAACTDGQQTWSAVYQSLALCRTATWIILASTTTTVSNSGL